MNIRNLTLQDIPAADAVMSAAYKSPRSWNHNLRMFLKMQPDGWFVAEQDGEIIGTCGATDYGAFAHIGLMTVRPDQQRRGLGLALMEHVLGWINQHGCPVVTLDASVAGAPLYERLGFVDVYKTVMYSFDDCASLPPLSEHVTPMRDEDIAALVDFDTPIFGACREAVLRAYLANFPQRAFVARDERGAITGFVFAQEHRIGPWVAVDRSTAQDLLAAVMPLEYSMVPGATVPVINDDAADLLMRFGFSPQRSLRHMQRGADGLIGDPARVYGQASLAIG